MKISEIVCIMTDNLTKFHYTVRAMDGDKGINNKVTYSITKGPRDLFDIDATSGLVFTRAQLDREAEENSDGTFILEITVKEISKVKPPPSVSTEVTIILMDVNDETPTFRSTLYRAEINENAPQNTPVNFLGDAVPEVFDHDLVCGHASRFINCMIFFFRQESKKFHIKLFLLNWNIQHFLPSS